MSLAGIAKALGVPQRVVMAYRRALDPSSSEADKVLRDLAHHCHAIRACFVAGDPTMTAFNEGKRDVWLRIQAAIYPLADERELEDGGE